jgi:hypothetical protein
MNSEHMNEKEVITTDRTNVPAQGSLHTLGPWWVDDRRPSGVLQVQARHRGQGSSYCVASMNYHEPPHDEANARLIAAAPELLEALRELLAAQLTQMPSFEAGKDAQDAWADRRAKARNGAMWAIAKATGEHS